MLVKVFLQKKKKKKRKKKKKDPKDLLNVFLLILKTFSSIHR